MLGRFYYADEALLCPSQPPVWSASVRDNVLLGVPLDIRRLDLALEAAQLKLSPSTLLIGADSLCARDGSVAVEVSGN